MATAIQEIREMVKAAEKWLVLTQKTKGKWAPDSPPSVEIGRLGRRRA